MKVALRFAFAIACVAIVVMAVHLWRDDRQRAALFVAEHEHDMEVLRALEGTLEAVWSTKGEAALVEVVRKANQEALDARFRFVPLRREVEGIAPPDLAPDARAALLRGRAVTLDRTDEAGTHRQLTYLPLSLAGAVRGALELSESMALQEAHMWQSRVNLLLTTILLLTATVLAVLGVGIYAVGRPLRLVRARAQAVAAGDLGTRIGIRRHDEVGDLAREIDAMCDRIVDERLRLAAETDDRIATLERLRHTDRLTTVGQLASGVAHELGTPLNVIAARAKMIEADSPKGGAIADSARTIAEQSARVTGIVRQLLDFSRRQGPRPGVHNLREMVARTLDMLTPLARKSGVTLALEASEELLLARVDQNQMQQALANVVMNGIQAMPRGGRLTVRVGSRRVRLPEHPEAEPAEYLCVEVEDEGPGIPPEHLAEVFEPFFTTKEVGEGTGLGLSVARGILREHGGWIDVESEVGRGSRFAMFLARAAGDREARVEAAS
jgi:signal transduction histidine kinase